MARPWTGADFERHWQGADRKLNPPASPLFLQPGAGTSAQAGMMTLTVVVGPRMAPLSPARRTHTTCYFQWYSPELLNRVGLLSPVIFWLAPIRPSAGGDADKLRKGTIVGAHKRVV